MEFQELKNKASEMKNCLDWLNNKLDTVVVREIETIQTEVLREKGLKKINEASITCRTILTGIRVNMYSQKARLEIFKQEILRN